MRDEIDQEKLAAGTSPDAIQEQFTAQLKESYQREREPYVQWLADLQNRATTIMGLHDTRLIT